MNDKQQLAAMGEHMSEQAAQPLCMAKRIEELVERAERAERSLTLAGFTYTEGAQEWKPPIGPSAFPLLERIDLLTFLLRELRDGVEGEWCFPGELDERIDAALSGNLQGADVSESWLLSRLPQATPSQKEGGWTLEFEFLDSITDEVVSRHGYDTSLEVVETVLVVVDAMLATPKPEEK